MNKYAGKTCPFCKTEFKENDDIVICSSCDMPHHKDCWIENQGCTTFGCLGTIKTADSAETSVTATKVEFEEPQVVSSVFCTKCGTKAPSGSSFCCKCGAPLISPAVNRPPHSATTSNHTYSTNTNTAYVGVQNHYTQQQNSYQTQQTNNSYNNFQSVNNRNQNTYTNSAFTQNTEIDSNVASLVGTNQEYYIPKFKMMKSQNQNTSWNWAAFLFCPFWLIYRKMYASGIVFLLTAFIISLTGLFFLNLLVLGAYIALGIFANYIYLLRLENHANNVKYMNEPLKSQYLAKNGDVNTTALVLAIVGYALLTVFAIII